MEEDMFETRYKSRLTPKTIKAYSKLYPKLSEVEAIKKIITSINESDKRLLKVYASEEYENKDDEDLPFISEGLKRSLANTNYILFGEPPSDCLLKN